MQDVRYVLQNKIFFTILVWSNNLKISYFLIFHVNVAIVFVGLWTYKSWLLCLALGCNGILFCFLHDYLPSKGYLCNLILYFVIRQKQTVEGRKKDFKESRIKSES